MRKFTKFMAALALLLFMTPAMVGWGQTKTEGFESATTSTTYNSTVTVNANQSDCGIGWSIYYGTVSTNGALQGSKSAQMRWYKSASSNYPYLKSTTAIENLTNVAFKAKVGNTAVKMDVSYSTDGNSWTALATAVDFSNTNATDFSYSIPSGGKYIKIGVSSSSTAPTASYYSLLVDNVVFTYSSNVNTYTVTYHANVTGVSDIEVEYTEGDDVTVADNTFTNPGYAFTEWTTEANGTGDSYSPGDVIEDIDDDIDLYAQWEVSTSTTGNIKFGSSTGHVQINSATVTGDDDLGNEWTITTVGTTSFTQSTIYSQVGSSSKPATSITFTTTLPEEVNVTAMEVKFGGFSGTEGTITMKVGSQTIGTGSLNATNDVVVNSSSTATGDVLTVTVTNIAKGVKCYYISYTYEEATPDPAVATTTTIIVPSDFNTDIHNGTSAGTLTATVAAGGTAISGATVTWESSNTSVATIDANGAVTLVAVGTATITASYAGVEDQYRPSSDTYELTVIDSYAPGTQNNPYTVAQARAAIDAGTGTQGVYVTGIVCTASPQLYNNKYLSYYISDDGTETTRLEAYNGLGLNQANFTSVDDVEVGATVVIYGNLTKYNNTYELAANNYLVSYTAPVHAVEAPTFSPVAGTYTEAQTVTISCETSGATIYYTIDGTEPTNASTEYTTALAISTTTTVKAIAYVGSDASTVATATYHFCSDTDPYTVTEALAFNEYPANGIYVHGIVSTAPTSLSSGTLTYYISDDGTTTTQLEVYKGKDLENANFTAVDDIQVGDIVTVYGNVVIYNNTKEFAQGNYLVSFERPTTPAQEYTLAIGNPEHVHILASSGEDFAIDNGETANVLSGTEITLTITTDNGYVLSSYSVIDGNGDPVTLTPVPNTTDMWTFTMPASNVTISATAATAPAGNTYTLATSIESGKQYIIVGRDNTVAYAMGANKGDNRYGIEISVNGTTATAEIANTETNAHEFTISSLGGDYYSIMDATTSGGYLYAASSSKNHLKTETVLDENHNGDWEITFDDDNIATIVASNSEYTHNIMRFNNSQDLFSCYTTGQHPVYLYVKDETPITETYHKPITAYYDTDGHTIKGGYYLIASPIGDVAPAQVEHMLTDDETVGETTSHTFDLYGFDPTQTLEWRNYRQGAFNLAAGKGYLYGNRNDVELVFTGSAISGTTYDVILAKADPNDPNANPGLDFPAWNLVGNPFAVTAYITKPYYKMNEGGTEIISVTGNSVEAMEGIFVIATTNGEEMTFSTTPAKRGSNLSLNLTEGGSLIDRAIVSFVEGEQLPKFQLNRNSTKLYIPQDGHDYAVVRSEEMGAMPVNFKAENNGTYSLNFSTENVGFAYLHLIDNKTGNDVDLLQTPSYSFEAKTTDYESRFKLVFATGDNSNDDSFAFFSNGSFVINNEGNATLQVIDIMGRILKSESVNGCTNVSVNAAPGVYMLRLINGTDVKVQKVVVK